jgi:hypothetical protein
MGIYPQPNLWQCGPFALKHALVVLGVLKDERELSRVAGTHWWHGTDELQLARAAQAFDCDLLTIRRADAERARRELVRYLKRGIPVLLCVDEWGHWLTVVKFEQGRFILLDSREPKVLAIASWADLRRTWGFHELDADEEYTGRVLYDLHPVVPRFRPRTKAQFSLARARLLRRDSKRQLAELWDEYLGDLLILCRTRNTRSSRVFSLGEFFRRHGGMILEQVDYWHGTVDRKAAKVILDNLHFVADTYGLVIHVEQEKRAIAGITSILALWSAAEFGVASVYAPRLPARPRPRLR